MTEVEAQYGFRLLTGRRQPVVYSDVVVLDQFGEPTLLYDAKYKALAQTPSADDIYQLVTYCQRLGLTEATLVYPGRGAAGQVTIGDIRLNVVRLSPDDVEGGRGPGGIAGAAHGTSMGRGHGPTSRHPTDRHRAGGANRPAG